MCNRLPVKERVIIIAIIGICISFLGIFGGLKELMIGRDKDGNHTFHAAVNESTGNLNGTKRVHLLKFPDIQDFRYAVYRSTIRYQITLETFTFMVYFMLYFGAKIGNKYLLLPFLVVNTMYMFIATLIIIFISVSSAVFTFHPVGLLPLLVLVLILRLLLWMQTTVNQLRKQLSLEDLEPNQALSPSTQVVIPIDAEMNTAGYVPVTESTQNSAQLQPVPKYVAYTPDEDQPPSYYEAVRPRAVETVRLAP